MIKRPDTHSNTVMMLTGSGAAAIAVIRVNGPLCADFLRRHFSRPTPAGRCVHGELRHVESVIDDAVVLLNADGQSAEINLHGSPWTVSRAVALANEFGFAVVEQTEEPTLLGAFGDTLVAREVAAWLPAARSELAVRMLGAQMHAWKQLQESAPAPAKLREIARDLALWRMLHPPRVAIVGRPNAGKSTLANRLFEQERSITAEVAGTTRDWVGEYTIVDGLPIMLLDTPGIRDATDPIESAAIEGARSEIADADLVILLVDATAPTDAVAVDSPRMLRVFNKCDLPDRLDSSAPGVRISAKTGQGIAALRQAIVTWFGCANLDAGRPRWWTERQREPLESGVLP
jgi:small GTP-binding protein